MMEYLTKSDLRKLSSLCKAAYYESRWIMASEDASDLEKALANHHAEYMTHLLEKLDRIADSNAKRIEITI